MPITIPDIKSEKVTITVAGLAHDNWTGYSISSALFSTDSGLVSMSLPRQPMPGGILLQFSAGDLRPGHSERHR